MFAAFLLVGLAATKPAVAQNTSGVESPNGVVLVKLAPLIYPPLARQAHIMGDVKVSVYVRADGTVSSVELLSGHPMLAPAAVENAKKSEYECRKCTGETEYTLTYTFGFIEDLSPYAKIEERRVPTGKCLYLWKCGVLRVNTFDVCATHLPPEISQSSGRVRILAFPECLNTMNSSAASR